MRKAPGNPSAQRRKEARGPLKLIPNRYAVLALSLADVWVPPVGPRRSSSTYARWIRPRQRRRNFRRPSSIPSKSDPPPRLFKPHGLPLHFPSLFLPRDAARTSELTAGGALFRRRSSSKSGRSVTPTSCSLAYFLSVALTHLWTPSVWFILQGIKFLHASQRSPAPELTPATLPRRSGSQSGSQTTPPRPPHRAAPRPGLHRHQVPPKHWRRRILSRSSPPVMIGNPSRSEHLLFLLYKPSDLKWTCRISSLIQIGMVRSGSFRSPSIQRPKFVIHPKGYQPIRIERVAATCLTRIQIRF
jgi:hypothetical protein